MALKDIFKMTKANRYTADGREELIKAQEAETEDRRYNIGEISEKTGLQKTANGWVKPTETKYGKVTEKNGKWGVQQKLGKGSKFIEHKNEKDAKNALANYTRGYNTTEQSKRDPHSNEARQIKQWDKEVEKIRKQNRAERRTAHAEAAKKGNAARQDKIEKLRERAFNKTELEGLSKGKLDNLYKSEIESKPAAERNHGTEQKKRGPGAIHTPGKGSVGMDKMKEAAEKGLKGQELKEFMLGKKTESKPAAEESEFSANDLPEVGQKVTFNWKDKGKTGIKGTVLGFKTINGKTYARVRGEDKSLSPTGEFNVNLQILKSEGPRLNTNKGKTITGNIEQENGIWEPIYGEPADSAPRILTGDTRIRVRK